MGGQVVLVMGVSGSGKSTVGSRLADRFGWPFLDADSLHPAANVAKMAAGTPLTDEDRWPWLRLVAGWIAERHQAGESAVVACSALKREYRDLLRAADPGLRIAYLAGDRAVLAHRVVHRTRHFFPVRLLEAQLADLEEPGPDEQALTVDIGQSPEKIVDSIAVALPG